MISNPLVAHFPRPRKPKSAAAFVQRFAANGTLVFDFTDQPEMLKESPLGLQIHTNAKPQEFRFHGLVRTKSPEDKLVTVTGK